MRGSRTFGAFVAAFALSAGCASTSVRGDLDLLRPRVRAPLPERAVLEEVSPESSPDVARALAAPLSADVAVRLAMANNRAMRATLRELGVPRGEAVVRESLHPLTNLARRR